MAVIIKVGPFFEPGAPAKVDASIKRARHRMATRAKAHVDANLRGSIRHPTPFYQLHIDTKMVGDVEIVHDSDIVYGPWLEGVSERNRSTRFKGYFAFRRAHNSTERDAQEIAHALGIEIVEVLN